jgi:hypothetical protein
MTDYSCFTAGTYFLKLATDKAPQKTMLFVKYG